MKTLRESIESFIVEASKPVQEFESALGLKFPTKAKVVDGVLSFEMNEKQYTDTWKGWRGNVLYSVYSKSKGNITAKTVKDESELTWNFNTDSPKGKEKWIKTYTLNAPNGDIYEMVELQVRSGSKDTYYISIKKM